MPRLTLIHAVASMYGWGLQRSQASSPTAHSLAEHWPIRIRDPCSQYFCPTSPYCCAAAARSAQHHAAVAASCAPIRRTVQLDAAISSLAVSHGHSRLLRSRPWVSRGTLALGTTRRSCGHPPALPTCPRPIHFNAYINDRRTLRPNVCTDCVVGGRRASGPWAGEER